jgi:hypothetical protein
VVEHEAGVFFADREDRPGSEIDICVGVVGEQRGCEPPGLDEGDFLVRVGSVDAPLVACRRPGAASAAR